RFLRHLDRCSLLLHLIDATAPPEEALLNFDAIEAELSLSSPSLAAKPRAAVPTKLDLTEARDNLPAIREGLAARGLEVAPISAVSGEGLKEALSLIARRLEEVRGREAPRPGEAARPEETAAPKGGAS
ncbi:MAG: GTPase ObgE, partial [bacterium]